MLSTKKKEKIQERKKTRKKKYQEKNMILLFYFNEFPPQYSKSLNNWRDFVGNIRENIVIFLCCDKKSSKDILI